MFQLPHDAQVRRISWVVGLVDWFADFTWFLVPGCELVDPLSSAAPSGLRRFLFALFPDGARARQTQTKQRARPGGTRPWRMSEDQGLLDLGFLELDVLLDDRIILRLGHLVGHGTAVLGRHVEETRVGRREQLDLDGRCFRHGRSAFS